MKTLWSKFWFRWAVWMVAFNGTVITLCKLMGISDTWMLIPIICLVGNPCVKDIAKVTK